MLSTHAAARLLADAGDHRALAAIAAACGLDGDPAPLDADARHALGLPRALRRVHVVPGAGTLRALVVELAAGAPARELVARTAARLAARTPQLSWLLLATERHGHTLVLAAWRAVARGVPRVQALVVDRRRVVASDAETLAALAAAREAIDLLTHERWCEVLGRDALTRRFYRELERLVALLADDVRDGAATVDARDAHDLALLCASRLLFLGFLQAKGWLDGNRDWLPHRFAACMDDGGGFHARVLRPLWFGTLNTPAARRAPAARALGALPFLNGGLFARTPLERRLRGRHFSDAALGQLFDDLLVRYRFTVREDATDFSDAAVDPEMLGRAFESLMAATDRRASGAFYTPQPLVEAVTAEALTQALGDGGDEDVVRLVLAGERVDAEAADRVRRRLLRIRVLDPACGSGAFLVHALERLATLLTRLGDARPVSRLRRDVLTRSIFGVDASPMAVWLCELRLWLSVVVDDDTADPRHVPPLPNLDHHIRVGDALAGEGFPDVTDAVLPGRPTGGRVATLRSRYARATGRRKQALARQLEREERRCARVALDARLALAVVRRRDALSAARTRDLFGTRHPPAGPTRDQLHALRAEVRSLRTQRRALLNGGALPFTFAAHFADGAAAGGFDVIVGNPPWVRVHRIAPQARADLRRRFRCFRDAAWRAGAEDAGAGRGFAGQGDLAGPFVERSLELARPGGVVALLLPAKLWCALAGGGVRALLAREAEVTVLEDWSEAAATFDAAVYPSLLVARRRAPSSSRVCEVHAALHRRDGALRWSIPRSRLAVDDDPASPWLPVPPAVRDAFDHLAAAGTPLARSAFGRPLLGVKSGCNDAFVVELLDDFRGDGLALVRSGVDAAPVEHALLRRVLRGQDVAPWGTFPKVRHETLRILWTHDVHDRPCAELPPAAQAWLVRWRARLDARADARRAGRWWALFRTEAARCDQPRVAWADFGRAPRAMVLAAGDDTVPLNSCYVARCPSGDDALALAALLNGPLAAAWLSLVAEPARGGWRRYLGWTVARFPLPADWPHARALLAPLAAAAVAGDVPSPHALADAALAAYGVRRRDVEPLLTWNVR